MVGHQREPDQHVGRHRFEAWTTRERLVSIFLVGYELDMDIDNPDGPDDNDLPGVMNV